MRKILVGCFAILRLLHKASRLGKLEFQMENRSRGFRRMCCWIVALIAFALVLPVAAMTFTGAAPVGLIYTAFTIAEDGMPDQTAVNPAPMKSDRFLIPARRPLAGALLELPAEVTPGRPTLRPRYVLGLQSEMMRGMLNELGMAARQCYAPMVRANTKVSSEGLRGTVWLYARCSFE